MGLSRWFAVSELKDDIRAIEMAPENIKPQISNYVSLALMEISREVDVDILDILNSDSFNVVTNSDWAPAAAAINAKVRIPLLKQFKAGDDSVLPLYIGVSVLFHSVRAVVDYELRGNRKLILWCQKLWLTFADPELDEIPSRFV